MRGRRRAMPDGGQAVGGECGALVESLDRPVFLKDREGRYQYVNGASVQFFGVDREEVVGKTDADLFDGETAAAARAGDEVVLESGESVTARETRTVGGVERVFRTTKHPYRPDDRVEGVVGIARDVTDQVSSGDEHDRDRRVRADREMLADLVASTRSFVQARDREEVADLVADAVADVLGFELSVVRLFDREGERLVPAGTTDATVERLGEPVACDIDEGDPARAFVSGEPVVVADATDANCDEHAPLTDGDRDVAGDVGGDGKSGAGADADATGDEEPVVGSAVHLPMGVHGTVSIYAEETGAFSEVDREAIRLVATSGAAAANRAKREEEVREARERAETLVDRINGLIEDTVEVLVQAGTRDQLERGVVDQLVATDPYAFAWVARPDVAAERLDVTAWAGDAPELAAAVTDLPADLTAAREAGDPTVRALDDEQIRVTELDDVPPESVHTRAAEAGLGSMVAVPLVYREATYGVLTVYTTDPDAVAERERVVLAALGRAVANAVNAIESGRILTANHVIELEFTVRDAGLLLGRLSARTGGTLELAESVHRSDGCLTLYVTATGVDPETFLDALDDDTAVTGTTVVAARDSEVLVEVTVEDSLVELLADHGAVTRTVTAEDGTVHVTVELPYEADAREVFELVADRYPGTELAGYHEHERPVRTRQEFRETVFDRLTDRQATAVRTAYLGGFFEWPREVDGDTLADSMAISRPTYHQHLRAAQRKVFEELFDGHGRRD